MEKIVVCFIATCLMFAGCSGSQMASNKLKVEGSFFSGGSNDNEYVELNKINDSIWVHTSYANNNGNRIPSNGVVAVSSEGLILVDTPWMNEQTEELISLTKNVFGKDIKLAIITHAHEDRIGGIDALIKHNIDVRSTAQTAELAEKAGYKRPDGKLDSEPAIKLGDLSLETYYPGEGHSPDNLVVWFPQSEVLFAGCIVKSLDAKDLGSTSDANMQQWPVSVANLQDRYKSAKTVIPGHGEWGDVALIQHTLDLLKNTSADPTHFGSEEH